MQICFLIVPHPAPSLLTAASIKLWAPSSSFVIVLKAHHVPEVLGAQTDSDCSHFSWSPSTIGFCSSGTKASSCPVFPVLLLHGWWPGDALSGFCRTGKSPLALHFLGKLQMLSVLLCIVLSYLVPWAVHPQHGRLYCSSVQEPFKEAEEDCRKKKRQC